MPNVKIRISSGVETAGSGEELQERDRETMRAEKMAVTSIFAHQMINTAKQTLTYAINNVGNFTGDYVKQEQLNRATEIVGDLTTVGTGFAVGGVVGGIIAVAGITTREVFKAVSTFTDLRHQNIESAYIRARAGLTDGSRGTEN